MKNWILSISTLFLMNGAIAQHLLLEHKIKVPLGDPLEPFRDSTIQIRKEITSDSTIQYLQLNLGHNKKTDEYIALVDFGMKRPWMLTKPTGEVVNLRSLVDMMNYLHQWGWEYLHPISDTRTSDYWTQIFFSINIVRTDNSYIFKRKTK